MSVPSKFYLARHAKYQTSFHLPRPGRMGNQVFRWQAPVKRTLQESFTRKPVMPIAESPQCLLHELILPAVHALPNAQVVEAQVSWQVGLVVPFKERFGLVTLVHSVEALTPPGVIFWDGVVLGKVESNQAGFHFNYVSMIEPIAVLIASRVALR